MARSFTDCQTLTTATQKEEPARHQRRQAVTQNEDKQLRLQGRGRATEYQTWAWLAVLPAARRLRQLLKMRNRHVTSRPPDLRHFALTTRAWRFHAPALLGSALYPILVHRLAVSLHASSLLSIALPQLRFASLAVVSLRRDLRPQESAHAEHT